MIDRQPHVLKKCEDLDGEHLLDFFRNSFIRTKKTISGDSENDDKTNKLSYKLLRPATQLVTSFLNPKKTVSDDSKNGHKNNNLSHKLIRPATKLITSGVKFKTNHKADSFLDIKFKNGMLLIPQINMDDFHSSFFMNCMAFEQCYFHCSKDITTYVVFMGCLMSTSADASLLSEHKIIENYFGTDKEIAKFFKTVGKDVAFDSKTHYLSNLFLEVNKYCMNGWHVGWAGFKHRYFENPWASISASAAFLLLLFAALQTLYTVIAYYEKSET